MGVIILKGPQIRDEVYVLIKKEGRALRPKEVAEIGGINHNTVRRCMAELCKAGLLKRLKRGVYEVA